MANKSAVLSRAVQGAQSVAKARWNLVTGDTAEPIEMTDFSDRSVQVAGNFGAGTVTIEGSNDKVDWFVLRDPQGSALSFTTAALKQILETTLFIRPKLDGSVGADVNITMCLRAGHPKSWS